MKKTKRKTPKRRDAALHEFETKDLGEVIAKAGTARVARPKYTIEYGVNHLELERRVYQLEKATGAAIKVVEEKVDAVHTAAENLLSITQIDGEEIEALKESLDSLYLRFEGEARMREEQDRMLRTDYRLLRELVDHIDTRELKASFRIHVATSLLCVGLIADMVLWWVLR